MLEEATVVVDVELHLLVEVREKLTTDKPLTAEERELLGDFLDTMLVVFDEVDDVDEYEDVTVITTKQAVDWFVAQDLLPAEQAASVLQRLNLTTEPMNNALAG